MKKIINIFKNPLIWIFVLALALRIYRLGEFPYGFHVDEVKVAWNASSILQSGYNDKNETLTLYYDSFGDFRPSGIFYFTVPFISLFGQSEFATRLPVALIGALSIFPIYFLVELLRNNKNKNKNQKINNMNVGYIAAFLMAISPWHIELSRATNEVVISTFLALFSLVFFISLIKTKKVKFALLAIISMGLSYLFYHSIRLMEPIFLIVIFGFYFREIKNKNVRILSVLCIVSSVMLTIFFGLNQDGLARLDQTSIIKNVDTTYQIERIKSENQSKNIVTIIFDNKLVIYFKTFISEYGKYFSEQFLTGGLARPYRFATPGVGVITYIELILIVLGIVQILRGKRSFLPLLLLVIAPLPAALTSEDSPNLSRAFLMLPFFICIAAFGVESIISFKGKFKKQIVTTIALLLFINFSYFVYMYFNHSINHRPFLKNYVGDSPTYRNVGTKELVLKLDSLKTKYDKIIITTFPDSPYPWYAFFTNKIPSSINQTYKVETNERIYGNIIFSQDKCPSDYSLVKYSKQNILIIDSWECPFRTGISNGYPLKIVGNIQRPDGSEVFAFLERDWSKPLYINGVYY